MASTYSDLKIQLMATGENSTTWGTITNVNLGTALEEAITGSANVAFSSGDVTLTLTNTNATQSARNLRLNCTGTTGGARNLILGSGCQIEKVYIVNNGCADTITVKNTTGNGIAVPAGKTMYVFNNGTDVVDAITHLTSLTLASALPIASGGTGSNTATFSGENITSLNASNISSGTLTNARTTAASANGASTIVARDASGNFSANTITATLSGNATNVSGTVAVANGGTGATSAATALTNLGAYPASNPSGYTTNTGTVTSVATSGSVNGLTLTGGTITSTGTITLGGAVNASTISTGVLAVANGGTGSSTATFSGANITSLNASSISSGTLASARLPTGSVITVLQAFKTDAQTIVGSTYVDITGLSITLTPASSSSKFLLMPKVFSDGYANTTYIQLVRDSTGIGNSTGGSVYNGNSYSYGTGSAAVGAIIGVDYLDSPSTTSSITYKIQAKNIEGGTMYINRSNSGNLGAVSSFTIMEIVG